MKSPSAPPAGDDGPPPPTYAEATGQGTTQQSHVSMAGGNENAAEAGAGQPGDEPPSYDSVFGHIREAKKSSTGMVDFLNILLKPVGCLVGCILLMIMLAIVFGLPVTMVVVGALYKDQCPIEPGIPIWLLVGGVVSLVHILFSMRSKQNGCIIVMFGLFYFSWFIAGCVLVYPNFPPSYEKGTKDKHGDPIYCDRTLYVTSFVIAIMYNVVMGLLCCVVAL